MARITSEDAVKAVGNRFDLILIASRRARELSHGWAPLVKTTSSNTITALKEIEAGKIGRDYLFRPSEIGRNEKPK